jgi:hypothetical protein
MVTASTGTVVVRVCDLSQRKGSARTTTSILVSDRAAAMLRIWRSDRG